MNQTRERAQNGVVFIIDIISLIVGYYLSGFIWLFQYKNISHDTVINRMNDNIIIVLAAYAVAYIFYSKNIDFIRRGRFEELKNVIRLNAVMGAVLAVYALLRKDNVILPRGVYVITIILNIIIAYILRLLIKKVIKWHTGSGDGARRMFIITNRERADRIAEIFMGNNSWIGQILGMSVIDENCKGQVFNKIPVVADVHSMLNYIKNEAVDEVYIDLGVVGNQNIEPLVMKLEDMGITVHIKLDVME